MDEKGKKNQKQVAAPSQWMILKYTLMIFLPVCIGVGVMVHVYFQLHDQVERGKIMRSQEVNLELKSRFFLHDLERIVSDMSFLAQEAGRHYRLGSDGEIDEVEKEDLEWDIVNFSENEMVYHQVRLLDIDGMEIIRVDRDEQGAVLIAEDQLQDKSQRYYVQEGLALRPEEVYISRFDLNIERGALELPIRPMIRFCCPFFDPAGHKRGLIVLNYQGRELLEKLFTFGGDMAGTKCLINADGYWLAGGTLEQNWAFMYDDRRERTFANAYPNAWETMQLQDEGQFQTDEGLFTFSTIHLPAGEDGQLVKRNKYVNGIVAQEPYWKILSYYPSEAFNAEHEIANVVNFILAGVFVFIFVIVWLFVKARLLKQYVQKRLEASEQQYRGLVTNIPGVVYRCGMDADWTMKFINSNIETLFGYKPDDFLDNRVRTFASIIHPEDRQHVENVIFAALVDDEPYGVEYRIVDAKGEVHWVYESGKGMVKGRDGREDELQGAIFDITEKRQAVEALKEAQQQADAANRAKTKFLANMSHEIRTPMNAIMGIAQSIVKKPQEMTTTQVEGIETIYKSGRRLLSLINSILDLSKVEAGKMEVKRETFSIGDTLSLITMTAKSLIENKDVTFSVERDASVPNLIISDTQMLHQVLMNMVGNSVKFTEHGSIVLSLRYDDGKLYCTLKDSGIGMKPEVLEHIFEEFEQADSSSTRQYQGSGLGLAIAKKFIEILGGQVSVESQVGKGTIFKFFIPVDIDMQEPQEQTTEKPKVPPADTTGRIYRVLVAEDDAFNQQAIGMMLEDRCEVTFADNGAQALEKAAEGTFDVVFSDIEMPVMDGCTFVDQWRQREQDGHMPVIAMTAWAMDEDRGHIMQHDFDDYITKPLDDEAMLRMIERYAAPVKAG